MNAADLTAANVMSRTPLAIAPKAPLAQAIRLMGTHRISGLPVVDETDRVVGILTEGDLLRRAEIGSQGKAPGWFASFFEPGRCAERYVESHGRRVQEVMTRDVLSITEDTPVAEIAALMLSRHVKRLPVLKQGKLVGIVSRADLVRAVGEGLDAEEAATGDDATIRGQILRAMEGKPWLQRSMSFDVKNGVVLLDGCVFDPRQRDAITVIAENTAGVKAVENRLICVEPNSGMVIYDPDQDEAPPGPKAKPG